MTQEIKQNIFLESPFYQETLSDKEININEDINLFFKEENINPNEMYEFENKHYIEMNYTNLKKELSNTTLYLNSFLDTSYNDSLSQNISTGDNSLTQVILVQKSDTNSDSTKQLINNKKRGRKKKEQKEIEQSLPFKIGCHDNMDEDNMMKKIKPFYHNFLIKFINQCLQQLQIKFILKRLNGQINSDTSIGRNKKIFNLPLYQILSFPISGKCKKFDNDYNEKVMSKIKGMNPYLDELLNLSYSYVYKELFISKNFSNEKFKYFVNCIPKQDFLETLLEKQSKDLSQKLLTFAKYQFVQKIENGVPRKSKEICK